MATKVQVLRVGPTRAASWTIGSVRCDLKSVPVACDGGPRISSESVLSQLGESDERAFPRGSLGCAA